jgi:predicted transglutaminase-like cysteine proteinase
VRSFACCPGVAALLLIGAALTPLTAAQAQTPDAPPAAAEAQTSDTAQPPLTTEQSGAIDDALKNLFADPGPQPGPDVFGYAAVTIGATPMEDMWRAAIDPAPALTGEWADLVGRIGGLSTLSRATAVNIFVNHHIAFADDLSIYGVADHWAGLAETIAHGRGDCEDFAIAKMQLLAAAGVSPRDLYVILVRDVGRDIDHAVLAVREDDRFYILDSANDAVRSAEQVKGYRPVVSFSGDARWTFGVRTATAVAAGDIQAQPSADQAAGGGTPAPRVDPSAPPYR